MMCPCRNDAECASQPPESTDLTSRCCAQGRAASLKADAHLYLPCQVVIREVRAGPIIVKVLTLQVYRILASM